ncbi:MAG TPA: hypothetical protein DCP08_06600 [Chloroflexi bacterium]|nr:hypothetical protein [Chloroflexota bacterium]
MLFALLAVLLAACAAHSKSVARFGIPDVVVHTSFSDEVGVASWGIEKPDVTAMGIGFVQPEHRDIPPLERPQTEEIRVANGEPFSSYLLLSSGQRTTLLVTALLDYKQVPFSLDGHEGLLHEITVEPGGDLELPMRLAVVKPGAHDLVVVAFKEPYDRPMDPGYRDRMFQRLVGRRVVIVVGGVEEPIQTPAPDILGSPPPPEVTFGLRVAFATAPTGAETHPSKRFMAFGQGRCNETFPYQLWVSNYHGETPVDYALVLFQDFHQVQLKGKDMVVVHLEAGHEVTIDDGLMLPAEPCIHELQVVYVIDPYRSILRDEVTDPFVHGSNAVGIQVDCP